MASPVVSVRHLSKTFGENLVLNDVNVDFYPGKIHGLLGHNGSGKSTLIKILSGYHKPDPGGELFVRGQRVALPVRADVASALGLGFVHQGLGLADDLSVVENIAVTHFDVGFPWRILWTRQEAEARQILQRFNVDIDPAIRVGNLPPVQKAIVAIARALRSVEGGGGRLLVLDEPTVYLSRDRVATLLDAMRSLAAAGDAVVFVSHRIDEVLAVTHRVSVLRNGELVATEETDDVTEEDLVRQIVGRNVGQLSVDRRDELEAPYVRVRRLSSETVGDISFEISRGEVLGITGLAGSGYEDIPYLLFGAGDARQGTLHLGDQHLDLVKLRPAAAIQKGIALVPADRPRLGGVGTVTVRENMTVPTIARFFRRGWLHPRNERLHVASLLRDFDIRPPNPEELLENFSGGNQQKSILAKWLDSKPQLLVLHEPTQGVDVGGRFELWKLIRQAAHDGVTVLAASETAEELAQLCDRVLILRDGQIAHELHGQSVTEETIVERCLMGGPARNSATT